MILVPFILLGALGIAAVIYSKQGRSHNVTNKGNGPVEVPSAISSPLDGLSEPLPSDSSIPSDSEILALAIPLEELLRKRINGMSQEDSQVFLSLLQQLENLRAKQEFLPSQEQAPPITLEQE